MQPAANEFSFGETTSGLLGTAREDVPSEGGTRRNSPNRSHNRPTQGSGRERLAPTVNRFRSRGWQGSGQLGGGIESAMGLKGEAGRSLATPGPFGSSRTNPDCLKQISDGISMNPDLVGWVRSLHILLAVHGNGIQGPVPGGSSVLISPSGFGCRFSCWNGRAGMRVQWKRSNR